jgi:ribosome-associated toxin RatA of RatAB toxin-antitoxin module
MFHQIHTNKTILLALAFSFELIYNNAVYPEMLPWLEQLALCATTGTGQPDADSPLLSSTIFNHILITGTHKFVCSHYQLPFHSIGYNL